MLLKNKKFWIVLISLIVFLGASYCLFIFILYDDEITESKGVVEITFEGKPVNITDMVTISFTEGSSYTNSDVPKPITIENTGKKIYLDMNTWEKTEYMIKIIVNGQLLGRDKKNDRIIHEFTHVPVHQHIDVQLEIKINYYKKDNNWYADINFKRIDYTGESEQNETFLLKKYKKTSLGIGP